LIYSIERCCLIVDSNARPIIIISYIYADDLSNLII